MNDSRAVPRFMKPITLLTRLLLIVFAVETLVMYLLDVFLRDVPAHLQNLIDSLSLSVICAPFIWWVIVRPFQSESEHRYHSLFENMMEGLAYCKMLYDDQDRPVDFVYLDVNVAFERLTGLKDVVGRKVTEVIPGIKELSPELFESYGRVAITGEPEKFEFEFKSLSQWLIISVYSPEKGYFVAVFDNITEQKLAEVKLRESQAQIIQQEKMASIGQLAAGVAHEINNPMGYITSNMNSLWKYAEKLAQFIEIQEQAVKKCADEATKSSIVEMKRQIKLDFVMKDFRELITESLEGSKRVSKIVQDLKSFSRAEGDDAIPADLNECIKSTLNVVHNEIKYVAELDIRLGDISQVVCRPQQISQVVMNLLVNAAHSISGNGVITLATTEDDGTVEISVADNGCGISPENMEKIFEPFFTTKEVGKGTGLGLSISYDIIKKHGGTMSVESEVGVGTTFIIRLPLNHQFDAGEFAS